MQAFGLARYDDAISLLRPLRAHAHRFGGSHAQRDLLELTLLEAAIRGGRHALAEAISSERSALRPDSPLNQLLHRRARNAPPSRPVLCVA